MRRLLFAHIVLFFVLASARAVAAAGSYLEVRYPFSTQPGELQLGVTYTLWIPDGVATLRGIIVHQHGCGAAACKCGATAAYDLHWQALARKWDCALLGPSYQQEDTQDCRLWYDARNGSAKTFLRALGEFASKSKHPELDRVPWCLWGHSGGGFWASLMETMYPERIVAVWLRSGTAYATWEKVRIPRPEIPSATYTVPTMCNVGVKEKGALKHNHLWVGCVSMFQAYREQGAPIGLAPDPRTGHECGDCRDLAIPFFDACLAVRLPAKGSQDQTLKPVDMSKAWLAPLFGEEARPAAEFQGNPQEAVWLPNKAVAKAWMEYVKTGAVSDTSPPPAPFCVKATPKEDEGTEVTWSAEADFESGIGSFIVLRDGQELARVPQTSVGRFGRPLFQSMTGGDTPCQPMPEMRYLDASTKAGEKHAYAVITVNGAGLKSGPSAKASWLHPHGTP